MKWWAEFLGRRARPCVSGCFVQQCTALRRIVGRAYGSFHAVAGNCFRQMRSVTCDRRKKHWTISLLSMQSLAFVSSKCAQQCAIARWCGERFRSYKKRGQPGRLSGRRPQWDVRHLAPRQPMVCFCGSTSPRGCSSGSRRCWAATSAYVAHIASLKQEREQESAERALRQLQHARTHVGCRKPG